MKITVRTFNPGSWISFVVQFVCIVYRLKKAIIGTNLHEILFSWFLILAKIPGFQVGPRIWKNLSPVFFSTGSNLGLEGPLVGTWILGVNQPVGWEYLKGLGFCFGWPMNRKLQWVPGHPGVKPRHLQQKPSRKGKDLLFRWAILNENFGCLGP